MQMTTITKSKSVSFSFLSRPTYPVLLLIFYLQQEIKLEWPKHSCQLFRKASSLVLLSSSVCRHGQPKLFARDHFLQS